MGRDEPAIRLALTREIPVQGIMGRLLGMKCRGWALVGNGFLLLALVLIRYVGLFRYPAPSPDEGFWTMGAKNLVMFHDPLMDHRLHPFLSPSTFVMLTAYFEAVGPSLLAARVYSATVGLLAVGLMYGLGRRSLPKRPWLLAILFGMSSMVVLENRLMKIETQQILWLAATAFLWLRTGLRSAAGAGACFGIALLTKSNSIYLVPALIWSAYDRNPAAGDLGDDTPPRASARSRVVLLGLIAGSIAALGYLGTYAAFPEEFWAAHKYELDGQHFLSNDVVFHVGRFGLNPAQVKDTLLALVKGAPFWVAIVPFGLVLAARQRWVERSDRLFGAWLVLGFLFFFSQIYIAPRYLATLAPAFAYFAARTLNDLLDAGARWRWAHPAAVVLLALFLGYHTGRIACGVHQNRDANAYSEAVVWVTRNVPSDDRMIAAPYIGISLPQRSCDHFRMTRGYGHEGQPRPLADVVRYHDIQAIVVDEEVRLCMTPQDESFLRDDCARVASFGAIEVYRVQSARRSWR